MSKMSVDIAINGGMVCSFNPDCLQKRNIGIRNGKIVLISEEKINGTKEIDASGKIVAPGFIDFHSHVDGKQFSGECMVRQGATTTIGGERNFDGIRVRQIFERGFIMNQGYYISHSFSLRKAVGIDNPYRAATEREQMMMRELAEEFFINGAFGIHFGLEFVPGTSKEEIVSLSEVAEKYRKPIVVHSREDGRKALESLEEIIEIAQETGAAMHILHLEYMLGYNGVMKTALERMKKAIREGADISADTGVYAAFPACIGSSIFDDGWREKYRKGTDYDSLVISSGAYAGEPCTKENFDYLRKMLPNTLVTAFVLDKDTIAEALREPFVYVSTNGADGPHYEGAGHPETSGTFPRLMKQYVRENKTLELTEAIKKCTYLPAVRFGIEKRGNIKIGYYGDIVIFDFDRIEDRAYFMGAGNPNMAPEGISSVLVNGQVVVDHGQLEYGMQPGLYLNTVLSV